MTKEKENKTTDKKWKNYLNALKAGDSEAQLAAFSECTRNEPLPEKYDFVFTSFPPSELVFELQAARQAAFLKEAEKRLT